MIELQESLKLRIQFINWRNDMRGIFLDDERNPEDVTWIKYPENVEWFIVRTVLNFLQ